MVANPEICRRNGAKSRGPVTERGKAIASRNATKHGILATSPPLLATEDLSTFEGMMQGLIDEYEPQSPTEHLLVQQVAMAWLRLHRLWAVEAAVANVEVLQALQQVKYPDFPALNHKSSSLAQLEGTFMSWGETMQRERDALQESVDNLSYLLEECPQNSDEQNEWIQFLDEVLYSTRKASIEARSNKSGMRQDLWLTVSRVNDLIADAEGGFRQPYPAVDIVKAAILEVIAVAKQEITQHNQLLAEYEQHQQRIQQAKAISQGLQNPERYARYEKHITTELNGALARLAQLKQERAKQVAAREADRACDEIAEAFTALIEQQNNEGSIGSFRQRKADPDPAG